MNDMMKSRREFLASTLCAGMGVCAVGALTGESLFAAESAGKIRLGLATYQWGMNWDIPTLMANLQKAKVLGVELRTQSKYKHGVELELNLTQRTDVKKRFADSPVALVAIACSERMDWPEPGQLKAAIEASKKYLQLCHDVGASSLRVFPNQFHPDIPREKTIEQIAKAVNELGAFAEGLDQRVDLEAHGPAGEWATMKAIMDQVTEKTVGVRLNCDQRDKAGAGLEANFNLVKGRLAKTVHLHNLKDADFPYQQQITLLVNAGWEGWDLMENTEKEPDVLAAMIEQREIWERFLKGAQKS
jgi:sugar phosphate isomerase/epimerase